MKNNLAKKYKEFSGEDVGEEFSFVPKVKFVNRKLVSCKYKSLQGDKVDLYVEEKPMA